MSASLLKKRLWHRCFPVNLVKFLRKIFFHRTLPVASSELNSARTGKKSNSQYSVLQINNIDLLISDKNPNPQLLSQKSWILFKAIIFHIYKSFTFVIIKIAKKSDYLPICCVLIFVLYPADMSIALLFLGLPIYQYKRQIKKALITIKNKHSLN